MEMTVNLFAALRDGVGTAQIHLPWKQGLCCRDLLEELKNKFQSMASLLEHSFIAVNGAYAEPDKNLMPEDEVAVLPPVSGG